MPRTVHTVAQRLRHAKLVAVVAIAAVALTGGIVGQAASPAYAIEYPSWEDVQNARSSESAKQAEITRIQDLLAQLETTVTDTQAASVARGEEYQVAQDAFDEADFKASQLQEDADEAEAVAADSKLRAGQLAARISRGGSDVSATLFFDSGSADDLLSQLGMASKITDQSAGIYTKATQDQNAAQSLTDQAEVAKDALKVLSDAAAEAFEAARVAAVAAETALTEQQENRAVLEQQLLVLSENRAATEADYAVGEQVRAVEAARVADLARQARAAEAASYAAMSARSSAASGGGGGGGGAPAGVVSSNGWALPAAGPVSSSYGYRIHPLTGVRTFHNGTDIAPGCGLPIYAAHSGTVTYAGNNGAYGNFVQVTGSGVTTGYAHIMNGGVLVRNGQSVNAGDLIARIGTTGASNGCHLHFEVRVGGSLTDAVPFLSARGIRIG
ncbi:peptidoglycan DD-metalloendopeptidase family protein [Marisediminicola senii]|uniref:peptidoglycan DD-metalloendopeptidase family protein n=1 Tax=Marisediminicola senii TaxID=2711233 RepID=UPI001F23B995|nr:M23 family metallopeptidase [Marisediminicola senii]